MGMRLTFGFEIDNILGHLINEEKAARDFANIDDNSLNKIMNYFYSNTADKCWGKDECYHCSIIKFVNKEFRFRKRIRAKMN